MFHFLATSKGLIIWIFQKETPSDQQLHLAALQGNLEQLCKVLDSGRVHVDCKDKVSCTKPRLVVKKRK